MTKQRNQLQTIAAMARCFRFRLGAICALRPGPATFPHGEHKLHLPVSKRSIKAKYSGKALYLIG